MTLDEIKVAAMKLDRVDRLLLIEELEVSVLTDEERAAIDAAAAAESERRYQEHLADPSSSRDAFEALDALEARLRSKK